MGFQIQICPLLRVFWSILVKCCVHLVSIKPGLRTADCGLGIKHGLGIKCGLRTEYKTRTRYKTRTAHYVYKNSLRKVKLREMESGLA